MSPGPGARLPDFLLVGAQKSGTSSLTRQLRAHPQIFMPPTELHFFSRRYERGVAWYLAQFEVSADHLAVGECSPLYMYDPRAGLRMAETLGQPRLIAILRDPVARAYSHYWHNRARGLEALPFADAVAAEAERRHEPRADWYAYVDRGRYLPQLQRMADVSGRDRVHVLLTDDLSTDREAALSRLLGFLGLDATTVPPPVAARNRHMNFRVPRLRGPIGRLPGPLRRVAARLNVRYTSYPPIAAELRRELEDRFAPDNAALAEWLGRDLGGWAGGAQR